MMYETISFHAKGRVDQTRCGLGHHLASGPMVD